MNGTTSRPWCIPIKYLASIHVLPNPVRQLTPALPCPAVRYSPQTGPKSPLSNQSGFLRGFNRSSQWGVGLSGRPYDASSVGSITPTRDKDNRDTPAFFGGGSGAASKANAAAVDDDGDEYGFGDMGDGAGAGAAHGRQSPGWVEMAQRERFYADLDEAADDIEVSAQVHPSTSTHTHTHTHTCSYVHMYTCTRTHVHTFIHTCRPLNDVTYSSNLPTHQENHIHKTNRLIHTSFTHNCLLI